MLVSRREVVVPDLGAALITRALITTTYRAHAVLRRGVISEDALLTRAFHRLGGPSRAVITVLLEGDARVTVRGEHHALSAGSVCRVDRKGDIVMRQAGDPYRAVVLEWDAAAPFAPRDAWSGVSIGRADRALLEAAERLHTTLGEAEVPTNDAARALARLVAALGLADVRPSALVEEVDPKDARLGHALDRLHSSLGDRPMLVDLDELGLSARHLNRVVAAFHARYAFNAGGWRDTRNRWRLMFGATLMTAPGATPERVARAMGYASTSTLDRAFANAGLPRPTDVPDVVAALHLASTSRARPMNR